MASWTNQSTSSLLPGEPWTSAKALAAFENPTALAEGASGAPKVRTVALQPPAAGTTIIRRFNNVSASYVTPSTSGSASLSEGSSVALVAGTIRFGVIVETSGTVTSLSVQILKNGTAVSTYRFAGVYTSDFTVAIGDRVELNVTVNGGGASGSVGCTSIFIRSATSDFAVS